jgi:hypothetical protein
LPDVRIISLHSSSLAPSAFWNAWGKWHARYKLELPLTSKVHPVVHVSQLKQCIGPAQQVSFVLPPLDALFRFRSGSCSNVCTSVEFAPSLKLACNGAEDQKIKLPGKTWTLSVSNSLTPLLGDKQLFKRRGLSAIQLDRRRNPAQSRRAGTLWAGPSGTSEHHPGWRMTVGSHDS